MKRIKFTVLFFSGISDYADRLEALKLKILTSYRDPITPSLTEVREEAEFRVEGRTDELLFPGPSLQLPEETGADFERRLLAALDTWPTRTLTLLPPEKAFPKDPANFPNLRNLEWQDGMSLQEISMYPLSLGKRLLRTHPGEIGAAFFVLLLSEPGREEIRRAADAWAEPILREFRETCALLARNHAWAWTTPLEYRGMAVPNPERLTAVADQAAAEKAAAEYRGPCYVVDLTTASAIGRYYGY